MIQDRRKRIVFVLGLIILVVVLLILMLWRLFAKEPSATPIVEQQPASIDEPIQQAEPQISPIAEQQRSERIESAPITIQAKTFAERYGSFSNEAGFQNLYDVMPFMSQSFVDETQAFIDSATPAQTYYGVTTRVITVNVVGIDETAGTATVELMTQREEANGSPEKTSLKYQKLNLEFVKEGELWKVNSASWL
jgi:hypothetical protein